MPELISIAREALLEITPDATIGAPSGETVDESGATSVTFVAELSGYPGWHWTVSIATLDGMEPSVLEVELMPGDGALLSPDWVPWIDRLAEYEAAQEALGASEGDAIDGTELAELDDDDLEDDLDDDLDDDADDDPLDSDVLHGGDLDGVDIDSVDIDSVDIDDPDELERADHELD